MLYFVIFLVCVSANSLTHSLVHAHIVCHRYRWLPLTHLRCCCCCQYVYRWHFHLFRFLAHIYEFASNKKILSWVISRACDCECTVPIAVPINRVCSILISTISLHTHGIDTLKCTKMRLASHINSDDFIFHIRKIIHQRTARIRTSQCERYVRLRIKCVVVDSIRSVPM